MNCEAGNDHSNLQVFDTGLRAPHVLPSWNLRLVPQALAKLFNVRWCNNSTLSIHTFASKATFRDSSFGWGPNHDDTLNEGEH